MDAETSSNADSKDKIAIEGGNFGLIDFGEKKNTESVRFEESSSTVYLRRHIYHDREDNVTENIEEMRHFEEEPKRIVSIRSSSADSGITNEDMEQSRSLLNILDQWSSKSEQTESDAAKSPTVLTSPTSKTVADDANIKVPSNFEEEEKSVGTIILDQNSPGNVSSSHKNKSDLSLSSKKVEVGGGTFQNAHLGDTINQKIIEGHIHRNKTVINEHHHYESQSPSSYSKEKGLQFLRLAQSYFHTLPQVNEKLVSEPIKMIVDMEANDQMIAIPGSRGKSSKMNYFGRDIEEIQLTELYDSTNDKQIRHAMILGEAGAGKSTLCGKFAKEIVNKKVENMKEKQLIVSVNVCDFQFSTPSTPFDLIFTQQMASNSKTKLSSDLRNAGQQWMENNSDKVMIIIDALDQSEVPIGGKKYPKFDCSTSVKTDEIIANIMAGHIWHNAHVLTSARFQVFSNLWSEQKPDRVVALRGFDEDNLRKAACYLNPENSTEMLSYLENKAPKLFALCTTPLYLSYTAEIFTDNCSDLPENVSGLLSAIFLRFMNSPHTKEYDLKSVTKLAYCGMIDKRFEFYASDFENIGVKYEDIKGLIGSFAILRKGHVGSRVPKKYYFPHQSLQEFCAALHIVNLEVTEVQSIVEGILNDPAIDLMRKLFYGIMLNDKVSGGMIEYIIGRKCSVEACRQILFNQLRTMIRDQALYDIATVTLLHECGDEVIQSMNGLIESIEIWEFDLLKSDQIILTSLIKQCSPLKRAFAIEFCLDPHLLKHVIQCYDDVSSFEAGYEIMASITKEHFEDVVHLLNNTKLSYVSLHCSEDVKNIFLSYWINQSKIFFQWMDLCDGCSLKNLNLLLKFLERYKMREIGLNVSDDLTIQDVMDIASNHVKPMQTDMMGVRDTKLTRKKLAVYLLVLKTLYCRDLKFFQCDLTEAIVPHFAELCQEKNVKLRKICVWDSFLIPKGYRHIPSVLNASECLNLDFGFCNLSRDKLLHLGQGFEKANCRVFSILIKDKSMDEPSYRELANVVKKSRCSQLDLYRCNLTERKISNLAERCRQIKAQLKKIRIRDNYLESKGYYQIPAVFVDGECEKVFFGNCNLSKDKLFYFGKGCTDAKCKIQCVSILDQAMDEAGYEELASSVKASRCYELNFERCNLTKSNISSLAKGCQDQNTQISKLTIQNDGFIPSIEMIMELCQLASNVVMQLEIEGWVLDAEQRQQLTEVFQGQTSKLVRLKLPGSDEWIASDHSEDWEPQEKKKKM